MPARSSEKGERGRRTVVISRSSSATKACAECRDRLRRESEELESEDELEGHGPTRGCEQNALAEPAALRCCISKPVEAKWNWRSEGRRERVVSASLAGGRSADGRGAFDPPVKRVLKDREPPAGTSSEYMRPRKSDLMPSDT